MRHLCKSTSGNIFSWGGLPMGIACYNSIGLFSDLVICALQRMKTEDKSNNLHLDQALVCVLLLWLPRIVTGQIWFQANFFNYCTIDYQLPLFLKN